ncbi:MAG TPA: UvrD-helicase domain-containing protein [Steroidobacteraceae bacterium]|nr:UvrD-helicase domain-containing protein [Steroidobacteraceae bacterium]
MSEQGDREARRRALDPQRSFIVQAPAGSGKTGLLTQRFLRLLTTVEAPEQIVAITFTRKAAAEMRRRVVEALENGEVGQGEYQRTTADLARAARAHADAHGWNLQRHPARLRIYTIDAFCSALAAQSPVLARAGAELRIADDARELYRLAAQRALARAGETDAGGPAVDHLLLHRDNQVLATAGYVAKMLEKREQWLPAIVSLRGEALRRRLEQDLAREIVEHLTATLALMPKERLARLSAALASAAGKRDDHVLAAWRGRSDPPGARLEDVARWRTLAASLVTSDLRNPEWRTSLAERDGFGAAQRDEKRTVLEEAQSLSASEGLRRELKWLRSMPDARLSDDQWRTVEAFVEVLEIAASELELVFRETGEVDYPAVLRAAIHAVRGEGEPTELAIALDRRVRHLLVDEFQDTSLAQFELLEALTSEWTPGDGRTLFCVGDPMQSIYRFRQAEVGLFLGVRERGLGTVPMEALQLRSNFRSQRRLVEWCNEVFASVLPAADSVSRGAVRHAPSEHVVPPLERAVNVHASFTPEAPVETARVLEVLADLRRRMPEATIGILVRQRPHVAHLAGALREAQIRFQAVELESLESRPVVRDLLSITRALLHEADRAAWLAVLRSPLCGLTLADLTQLVSQAAGLTLRQLLADEARVQRLADDAQSRVRLVRDAFERALAPAARRTLCRRVEAFWLTLGGPATVLDNAALEDASAYFDHLRKLEARGALPAGDFLDQEFSDLFAEPDPGASPRLQVMTVHKAKGLEFDVVLLPGLGRGRSRNDPSLLNWLEVPREGEAAGLLLAPIVPKGAERDAHAFYVAERLRECAALESGRLLYVAATRARRELHLFGHVKVRERDGTREMGAPEAGSALALMWPAVSGAFHAQFESDTTPATPAADVVLNAVLRRNSSQWRLPEPESAVRARGLRSAAAAGDVRPEFVWAGEVSRRVGSAVHAELDRWSRMGQLPRPAELAASRNRYARLLAALGVPAQERPAAVERVIDALTRTLEDNKGRWIFAPTHTDVRSEWAVSGTLGTELVDAVIDRTFRDAQGTRWIVDFKTSAHEGGALEEFLDNEVRRYREQLNRYAALTARFAAEPMRVGLYFPMLGAWREWGVE